MDLVTHFATNLLAYAIERFAQGAETVLLNSGIGLTDEQFEAYKASRRAHSESDLLTDVQLECGQCLRTGIRTLTNTQEPRVN